MGFDSPYSAGDVAPITVDFAMGIFIALIALTLLIVLGMISVVILRAAGVKV